MKRRKPLRILLIAVPLALLIALLSYFAYWNWPTHLFSIAPEEIDSVEFSRNGEEIVVRDPEVIHYLANHLSGLTFRRRLRVDSFPLVVGGGELSLRTKSGQCISFFPSQFIDREHIRWEAYPPGLNTDYIHELMETAPDKEEG